MTTYQCDEHYFDEITTKSQAYILGFIWADGHVQKDRGLFFINSQKDIEIFQFIQNELSSDIPIKEQKINGTIYSRFYVYRAPIARALFKLGLRNNKSNNNAAIPNLSTELIPAFLLGLFDGDGSIWKSSHWGVNFSGGHDFLCWVKQALASYDIKTSKIRFRYGKSNLNSCSFHITNLHNIMNLKKLLYSDAPFSLSRKRERFHLAEQDYHKFNATKFITHDVGSSIVSLYKDGMTQKQIHILLNVPFSNIRKYVQRMRKKNIIA